MGSNGLCQLGTSCGANFQVDGRTEPLDSSIGSIDRKLYAELPNEWRRRFNQFTIRLFRIVDYRPSEPGELFFRLNQPMSLTAAEQRNAFFGPVREQIKGLVEHFEAQGLDKEFLGFSNFRMAYDDVMARTALATERKSLAHKLTSEELVALYRADRPLSDTTVSVVRDATAMITQARRLVTSKPRFNKATFFTWLMFLVRMELNHFTMPGYDEFARFIDFFQSWKDSRFGFAPKVEHFPKERLSSQLWLTYEGRASSRVGDVSSVILRDAVVWLLFEYFATDDIRRGFLKDIGIQRVHQAFEELNFPLIEDHVAKRLVDLDWGKLP